MTPDQIERIRLAKRWAWIYGILAWVVWAVAKAVVATWNAKIKRIMFGHTGERADPLEALVDWGIPVCLAFLFIAMAINQVTSIKRIRAEEPDA
jgi:hypothetical protein